MKKKMNYLPDWRKIVAGMVIAATATIGTGQVDAQVYRTDTDIKTWNGASVDVWGPSGGPGTKSNTTAIDDVLLDSSNGIILLGEGIVNPSEMKSLTVTGTGWGIDEGLFEINAGGKPGDTAIDIQAGADFTFGATSATDFTGNVLVKGTVNVDMGALFHATAGGDMIFDGGTLNITDTSGSTGGKPSTRASMILDEKGGTINVGKGLNLQHLGDVNPASVTLQSGVTGADFTRDGEGEYHQHYGFVLDIGTGTATFKGGGNSFAETADFKAGALVVDGAGTTVTITNFDGADSADNYSPRVVLTNDGTDNDGSTRVTGGAKLIVVADWAQALGAGNEHLVTDSIVVNGAGSEFVMGKNAKINITGTAEATDGGKITIDTDADFSNFSGPVLFQLNDGTISVVNTTDTTVSGYDPKTDPLNDARSNANITVGKVGATVDVNGAHLNLTLTDDSKIIGTETEGGNFTKTGAGKLFIEESGEVDINGQAIFMGGDVTISSNAFKSVGIQTKEDSSGVISNLILTETAVVDAGTDDIDIGQNITLKGGAKLSGNDMIVRGNYTDAAKAVVNLTGTATFETATTETATTIKTWKQADDKAGFTATGIVANGSLKLDSDANVNGGEITAEAGLTLMNGTNATTRTTLTGKNLSVKGDFADDVNTKTKITDTATFQLLNTSTPAHSTIKGDFSAEYLVLGAGLDSTVNVKVNITNPTYDGGFTYNGYAGGVSYTGGAFSELDASGAKNSLKYTENVELDRNATLKSKGLTVKGEFKDTSTSKIDLANSETTNGDLIFHNDTIVNGFLANVNNITAKTVENGEDKYKNLTLNKGTADLPATAIFGTVTSKDLKLKKDETYEIGRLDIKGDFNDDGAKTTVTDTDINNLPNAKIAGTANIDGTFTSVGLDVGVDVELGKNASIDAQNGDVEIGQDATLGVNAHLKTTTGSITVERNTKLDSDSSITSTSGDFTFKGNFDMKAGGNSVTTGGDMTVIGEYGDAKDTTVGVGGEFKYRDGVTNINSADFSAGKLDVTGNQTLILNEGADVTVNSATLVAGKLVLSKDAQFGSIGNTVTNTGTVQVSGGTGQFKGDFVNAAAGTLQIGAPSGSKFDADKLQVEGDWTSELGNKIEFAIDAEGNIGSIDITGKATGNGLDNVQLTGSDRNKNQLGAKVSVRGEEHDLITAHIDSSNGAFEIDELNSNSNSWKFDLTPTPSGSKKIWKLSAENELQTPDISSFFLTNIIGFDLPRAQNVSGPWVRMKGGHLDDDKAAMDKVTFQMFQVGWDKSFDSAFGNGKWYAGIFMEGDWMYGRGNYYRMRNTADEFLAGSLRSAQKGMGTGLYVSRGFGNGWYVDLLGRISIYDTTINMNGLASTGTSSYRGNWNEQIFALGLEVGKTFTNRKGNFSLNPYNRIIYNSAPSKQFNIVFESTDTMFVRNASVDASTNQLGARLYWNSLNSERNFGNIYIGGDYFKGLSGRFGTQLISAEGYYNNGQWQDAELARKKNDLDYGQGTVGLTLLPKENFAVSSQVDVIFGDVSGWAVTVGARYSY